MRYHEIINELSKPETRQNADQILKAAGYQRLGKGMFGAVYEKPGSPYVLKLFTARDYAYLDFINLVRAHQDNPHFPRFFGKLIRVNKNYYAIRMEKLTKFDPHAVGEYTYDMFDYIQDGQSGLRDYPALRAACDLVRTKLLNHYHFDYKDESFMMRGNTVVITDPVLDLGAKDEMRFSPEPPLDPPAPKPAPKQDSDLLKQIFAELD